MGTLVVAQVAAKGGDQPGKGADQPEKPGVTVNANELYEAYKYNEAKADGLYNGKLLEVKAIYHGTVELSKPRKEKDGNWIMTFHHSWGEWNSPTTVIVRFRNSEVGKLAEIRPEKGLTGRDGLIVQGVCRGLVPGPSWTVFGRFVNGNPTVAISDAVVVKEFTETKP